VIRGRDGLIAVMLLALAGASPRAGAQSEAELGSASVEAPTTPSQTSPSAEAPIDRVRLGWRWIPGQVHTFESRVGYTLAETTTVRAEAWAYTPRTLDASGLLDIEGQLVGFGANRVVRQRPMPESKLRGAREAAREATPTGVRIELRLNGRITGCSTTQRDQALPHRLLGMHLPSDPVGEGDTWADASLALWLARWLPEELPTSVEGETRLVALQPAARGYTAVLEHRATVHTIDGGPTLEIAGTTWWDTEPGAIGRREVEIRLRGSTDDEGIGALRVEIARRDRDAVAPDDEPL
jgi:hypothetical protein